VPFLEEKKDELPSFKGTMPKEWRRFQNIDEMVAFSDIITAAEATQIAQGTYGTSGLSIPVAQHHYNQMRNN